MYIRQHEDYYALSEIIISITFYYKCVNRDFFNELNLAVLHIMYH